MANGRTEERTRHRAHPLPRESLPRNNAEPLKQSMVDFAFEDKTIMAGEN
jgi:hypothetical protein